MIRHFFHLLLLFALVGSAHADDVRVILQQDGVTVGGTRILNCTSGMTCSIVGGVGTLTGTGGGGGGGLGTLDRSTSNVDVTNTITETALYSYSLAGSTLGTDTCIKQNIVGTLTGNNTGALTLRAKYGAGVASVAFTPPSITAEPLIVEVTVCGDAATNAQQLFVKAIAGAAQTVRAARASTTTDSTASQTLSVTAEWGTASAALSAAKAYGETFASGGSTGNVTGPASATDNTLPRFDSTTGKLIQGSGVVVDDSDNVTGLLSLTLPNTGLRLLDTNASHSLIFAPGSDLTANRTLTVTTGDADRTLTLSGNATLSGTNTGDQTVTLTGDVTGSGTGSFAATIAGDAVTNAKMANVATATLKGRSTAGTGDPEDLTATQATALLDLFTSSAKGLVPASGGGTTNYLRADGTWAAPPGGGGGSGDVVGPASATDNALARFDSTTGKLIQNSGTLLSDTNDLTGLTTLTLPNTGLRLLDTNASHSLIFAPGSDLTVNRTLTVTTGDANRTLTLTGDTSLTGTNTGDQTIQQAFALGKAITGADSLSNALVVGDGTRTLKLWGDSGAGKMRGETAALHIREPSVTSAGTVSGATPLLALSTLDDKYALGFTNQTNARSVGAWVGNDGSFNLDLFGSSTGSFNIPPTGIIGITEGGTGAGTAQAAIDALTAVSGATAGHVLTKDGSGNATWQAATGGLSDPGANGPITRTGLNTTAPAKADQITSTWMCADAGTTDAYACNYSPAVTAYVTGAQYCFRANTVNTGTATFNPNSLGAKTIKKRTLAGAATLRDGDIRALAYVCTTYDGTDLIMDAPVNLQTAYDNDLSSPGITVGANGLKVMGVDSSAEAFTLCDTTSCTNTLSWYYDPVNSRWVSEATPLTDPIFSLSSGKSLIVEQSSDGDDLLTVAEAGTVTVPAAGTVDFGSAAATKPNKSGTSAPGTCSVGQTFFDTDATAGQNVFGCTATNTWTLLGDGGGGGSGDITDVWGCTTGNCNALTGAAGDSLNAASADSSIPLTQSTALPGTCTEGQVHQDTDSGGTETHVCTATNTWTKLIAATDNTATATALAANPTDCSSNQFANAIAANGNLTCAGIGDADVPDTITASNYLPLAGGTLTGQVVTDNLGIEFEESDTNPTCSSGNYTVYADASEGKFKKCTNGTLSDMDTSSGSFDGNVTGTFQLSGDSSPSQLTSDTNDLSSSGASSLRLTSDKLLSLTGIANPTDGRVLPLINDGAFPIQLAKESTSSTAANRFSFAHLLYPKEAVWLYYNATTSRWDRFSFTQVALLNDPFTRTVVIEDFVSGAVTTAQNTWTVTTSGTGASVQTSIFGTDSTKKALGVAQADTGTTATGSAGFGLLGGSFSLPPALGQLIVGWRCAVENLSTASEEFVVDIGWHDAVSTDPTDGIYFRYDRATAGDFWRIAAAGGGTRTYSTSSQAVGDGTYSWLVFVTNSDWTSVSYFHKSTSSDTWTSLGTITDANIPTAGEFALPQVKIIKTAGTTQRNLSCDKMFMSYEVAP